MIKSCRVGHLSYPARRYGGAPEWLEQTVFFLHATLAPFSLFPLFIPFPLPLPPHSLSSFPPLLLPPPSSLSSLLLLLHSSPPIPPPADLQYFNDLSCSHSHIVHVHVHIVPTMLTELLYPLQDGYTPLHLAASGGHTTCVERLLSTPGIDVNIKGMVSW